MTPDRRYDQEEAEEIFAIAARSDSGAPMRRSEGEGFTLAELQQIGGEAGIPPDHIAAAAHAVVRRGRALPDQTSLGMRVSVGQVVPLPRRPSDAEWDALVTELRDVFRATGQVREQGGAREWSNGALRVMLEPTVDGHQLRLTTVNRRFRSLNRMSMVLGLWGLGVIALLVAGASADGATLSLRALLPSLIVVGASLGFVGFSRLSLPKWADERSEQFEWIAERARGLLVEPPADQLDT